MCMSEKQKGEWTIDVIDIAEEEIEAITVIIREDPAWTGSLAEYFPQREGEFYTRLGYLAAIFWHAVEEELQRRLLTVPEA